MGQKNCCSSNSRLHYYSLFSILCRRRSCWKCCVLFLPSSLAWHISWKKTWNNSIQKVLSYLPTIYLCTLDKLFKSVCVATLTVFFHIYRFSIKKKVGKLIMHDWMTGWKLVLHHSPKKKNHQKNVNFKPIIHSYLDCYCCFSR